MYTIPYFTALELLNTMRCTSEHDGPDLHDVRAVLPDEVTPILHMLNQFAVAGFAHLPNGNQDNERAIYSLLNHEWVFDDMYAESCDSEFYQDDSRIRKALAPFAGNDVPVELVVALLLIYSALFATATIEELLVAKDYGDTP